MTGQHGPTSHEAVASLGEQLPRSLSELGASEDGWSSSNEEVDAHDDVSNRPPPQTMKAFPDGSEDRHDQPAKRARLPKRTTSILALLTGLAV
jgi:hypothetical protein